MYYKASKPKWGCCYVVLVTLTCLTLIASAIEDPETCENDNIMGALGGGVIASDNFYFDYRNSSTSTNLRKCIHRIYMSYKDSSKNRTICFTFHRFDLEHSEGCSNDYLEFPDNHYHQTESFPDKRRATIKFCGNGTWNRGNEVLPIANVFSPDFCWPAPSSTFTVNFQADTHVAGRGYFAEFVIHEGLSQTSSDKTDTPSGTCDFDPTECTQYCYHGHVVIDGCKTCACIKGATAPCFPDKYTCFNRNCVSSQLVCDGNDDCGDSSDENYLHARCPGTQGLEACNFDGESSDWCQYMVDSGWFRANSSPYGPRYDHTYGIRESGHFMYTEAYVDGQAFLSYTEDIQSDSPRCYSFWYFMNAYVGTLQVGILQPNNKEILQLWRREGNYGIAWLGAEIDFPLDIFPIEKIIIHANDTRGDDHNIAIDDLTFAQGKCWGGDLSCQFEVGFCKWRNDLDRGQMSWTRHNRSTEYKSTAPDHTGRGHYYVYVNSTEIEPGTQAVLISRPVSNGADSAWHCLTFSYHMYGSGMGQLKVTALLNDNSTLKNIWNMTGNQGNTWHSAVISFTGIPGPFQILVVGVVGQAGKSDFAVDDIIYTSSHCPLKTDPPPQHGTTIKTTRLPDTCAPGYWTCDDGYCIREDWVCDGRLDCGDRSDEMNCSSSIFLSVGTIVGISIALVFLLLVVGLAVFLVHRRQKIVRPPAAQSDSRFDLTVPHSPTGDQPPPYVSAIDNPAYSGPSSQLPSYNTVTKKLPPYSANVDPSNNKTCDRQKSKKDNKGLVGFGALGTPAGVPPGRSTTVRPAVVSSALHSTPSVYSQRGYIQRSSPYNVGSTADSVGSTPHNVGSTPHNVGSTPFNVGSTLYNVGSTTQGGGQAQQGSAQYPTEPPPAYGETVC